MARRTHPKPPVEKALRYAESNGWTITPKTGGHAWGTARCTEDCVVSIWSTPKNPDNFARQITRRVDKCPH
jgi:hypothetical protein